MTIRVSGLGRRMAVLMTAMLVTACSSGDDGGSATGGGGGSSTFTPGTKPADICALLTLAEVQTVLPTATAGVEEPTGDNTDLGFWADICKYDAGNQSLELVVFVALTEAGLQGIKLAAASGDVNTPVSGVGTEAHHWEDTASGTGGLWALDSPYSVDITNYFPPTQPTADQMKPLVSKVLGELQQ